jgi:hypothetical protein
MKTSPALGYGVLRIRGVSMDAGFEGGFQGGEQTVWCPSMLVERE